MKEEKFANSKNGGGLKTKKRKKAFTLIELLAIIVILAIIAVITVPIILNIIENSRKGAATDSAYGYKDAVNKYYVTELSDNNNLKLEGEYTVSNGSLTGKFEGSTSEQKTVPISVSGDKPSSGKLRYANNVLNAGCLVIGDYKISFGTDGKVNETVKGDCSTYEFPVSENVPTIASCLGCVFSTNTINEDKYIGTDTVTNYETDYTKLNRHVFLGYILDKNTHIIQRAFLCGINGTTPFCIEGTTDNTKRANDIDNLNEIFSNKEVIDDFYYYWYMDGHNASSNRVIRAYPDGSVESSYDSEYGSECVVNLEDGRTGCYSS